ncbi:hypothetical protein ACQPWW_23445 [Micromonospora sp. CA-240977]|uniref:hypothetical protein n=1 Tax=Micromonospora sp. CA-240977 TaxID=3239957 RepID=UPI003D9159E5
MNGRPQRRGCPPRRNPRVDDGDDIVSVQNLFNLTNRQAEPLLDYATGSGIAFIPWFGSQPSR